MRSASSLAMIHAARSLAAIAAIVAIAVAVPARAEGDPRLRVDWTVDGTITGLALVGWGASELAKDTLTPGTCRWCTPPGIDRSARSTLLWSDRTAAQDLSDALVVSIPAAFAVYDVLSTRDAGGIRTSVDDVLVVAEAVSLTGLVTNAVKYAVARQRPYATPPSGPQGADARLSFWSGHTSVAFAAVAAGGSVAEIRGYDGWPWVYGIGFTAAAATGYFRLAGDQHWLTDVLAGAAAGSAIGFAVPWLHRGVGSDRVSLSVIPGGLAVTGRL